ncbi:molecular chaperone [Ferrimonas balearica]|uniref:TorD/DmsD family molecular chaperone n=1 Tax=Ferrimonas balearica TaxID=44012 RepID=UPI001C99AC3B|nr:molecular chaperone TorD family protein [Ferrimonas balearica]MBY5920803.1 molecular chaperone TorD family protein [Ferrimonas balearica]MBY5996512.1 molecular chaperone TorD family protein [Ferrimonas balearica]
MSLPFGAQAAHYQAFKGMVFQPGCADNLEALIQVLEQGGQYPELLAEARALRDEPERLEYDFNRMCIGPYRLTVPPYESVYRSGKSVLNSHHTVNVHAYYQQLGLTIEPRFNEPADYIGNELEFLFCASALAFEHREAGNPDVALELDQLAGQFLEAHLGTWCGEFSDKMMANAREPFWRHYGAALNHYVQSQMTH